jgi:predicted flap endonuclease-1-like 5' DNA nuclease
MGRVLAVFFGLVLATAGVLLFVWILWLLWQRSEEEKETPSIEIGKEEPAPATRAAAIEVEAEAEPAEEAAEELPEPDDLKRIEGIGPKISSVLQAAGITTFAQLADADADQLRQVVEEADPRLLRLADPTSWPEQASLAATGEWEAFDALLKELKAGRRA